MTNDWIGEISDATTAGEIENLLSYAGLAIGKAEIRHGRWSVTITVQDAHETEDGPCWVIGRGDSINGAVRNGLRFYMAAIGKSRPLPK